jgi:hypothetical protein
MVDLGSENDSEVEVDVVREKEDFQPGVLSLQVAMGRKTERKQIMVSDLFVFPKVHRPIVHLMIFVVQLRPLSKDGVSFFCDEFMNHNYVEHVSVAPVNLCE